MKKIIYGVALLATVALAGCQGGNEPTPTPSTNIKILTPTGAPAVGFFDFSDYANFETNAVPANVLAAIRNDSPYSVVVAPTQGGVQAINRDTKQSGKSDFKLAATITFGNFYVGKTGHDTNSTMELGDEIVLFGQNTIPDQLFKKVYSDLFVESNLSHIHYVAAASDAVGALTSGKFIDEGGSIDVDYVLVAEPAVQGAIAKGKEIYSNIQDEYKKISGGM